MRSALVITLVGVDRPGLVDALASRIRGVGGNWEEARLARLAGRFAGVVQVSIPKAQVASLKEALGSGLEGLTLSIEDGTPGEPDQGRAYELELTAPDQPGIVADVSRALVGLGANIERLDSCCVPAAMAGGSLFVATALVVVPGAVGKKQLANVLEAISDALHVEIESAES
jgi:glycine cleavage system regulatory protein